MLVKYRVLVDILNFMVMKNLHSRTHKIWSQSNFKWNVECSSSLYFGS